MRPLNELLTTDDPAISLLHEWACAADARPNLIFKPDLARRGEALVSMQVTTHSMLGALIYETGGVEIDGGRLRLLGTAVPEDRRSLVDWNRTAGDWNEVGPPSLLLIADDIFGGFFAINGGALGAGDIGTIYYLAPDTGEWEATERGYTSFVNWCLTGDLDMFYEDFEALGVRQATAQPAFDQCFQFYPPLWTQEGRANPSCKIVPIAEVWGLARGR